MISILLTPNDADAELAEQLEKSARVIHWPETIIAEPESYLPLDESLDSLFGYDWLVLKNEFAADYFARRYKQRYEAPVLDNLRVLAIGEAAADKLLGNQMHVDVTLDTFAIASAFEAIAAYAGDHRALARLNFLVPSANLMREFFEQRLEDADARVDNVIAYRTTPDNQRLAKLTALIIGGGINYIVFSMRADLIEFAQLFDTNDLVTLLSGVGIVCCGRETAATAARYGLMETIQLDESSSDSLPSLITTMLADDDSAS